MSYKIKPQIKLYKFNGTQFELQAIIDDYQECSFEHTFYSAGTFTISINYNIPNAQLFQRGLFVQFGNNPYDFGEILKITDSISSDGKGSQVRNIEGYDARYILKKRIIRNMNSNGKWETNAKSEYCIRRLIQDQCGYTCGEEKRKLPFQNKIKGLWDFTFETSGVSQTLRSVIYSEDLGIFVAAANNHIITSPDGINWTERNSGVSDIYGICYSEELNLFVAINYAYGVTTSSDGVTWTPTPVTSAFTALNICYSKKLNLFVVCCNGGKIYTSSNGTIWTLVGTYTTGNWRGIVYSEDLGIFVAVGTSGKIMTSSDGINWTERNSGVSIGFWRITYSEELKLFAVTGDIFTILTSPDGINWRTIPAPSGFTVALVGIMYSREMKSFIAVGGGRTLYLSSDGINWKTRQRFSNSGTLYSICYSENLGKYIIVGTSGKIISSTDSESSDNLGNECTISESYSNLYDVCETIATQSELGWRFAFDGKQLNLEVYKGVDRHNNIQFSPEFNSIENGTFIDTSEGFSNAVYIGGQGQNAERDIYEGESVTDEIAPSGLERYESWNESFNLSEEEEFQNQAGQFLIQYGQTVEIDANSLAKCPYVFREQYDIGDSVTVKFSGKQAVTTILSVTEHWVFGEYSIQFGLGKPRNELKNQLQLMLRKIQKASDKSQTTDSIRWYQLPEETSMSSSEVSNRTIGFVGNVGSGKTFRLYYKPPFSSLLSLNSTGSKLYHVYVKQLQGDEGSKLTLTTGISGASNLELDIGTYVALVYVDSFGNVLKAI